MGHARRGSFGSLSSRLRDDRGEVSSDPELFARQSCDGPPSVFARLGPKVPTSTAIQPYMAAYVPEPVSEPPLAGMIFGCTTETYAECINRQVFGLPLSNKPQVLRIAPGANIFLFDFYSKVMHGIFVATSYGGMHIAREAFGGSFGAQVKVQLVEDCPSLPESVFREAIHENYINARKFKYPLNNTQEIPQPLLSLETVNMVQRLIQLFRDRAIQGGVLPRDASHSRRIVQSHQSGHLQHRSPRQRSIITSIRSWAPNDNLVLSVPPLASREHGSASRTHCQSPEHLELAVGLPPRLTWKEDIRQDQEQSHGPSGRSPRRQDGRHVSSRDEQQITAARRPKSTISRLANQGEEAKKPVNSSTSRGSSRDPRRLADDPKGTKSTEQLPKGDKVDKSHGRSSASFHTTQSLSTDQVLKSRSELVRKPVAKRVDVVFNAEGRPIDQGHHQGSERKSREQPPPPPKEEINGRPTAQPQSQDQPQKPRNRELVRKPLAKRVDAAVNVEGRATDQGHQESGRKSREQPPPKEERAERKSHGGRPTASVRELLPPLQEQPQKREVVQMLPAKCVDAEGRPTAGGASGDGYSKRKAEPAVPPHAKKTAIRTSLQSLESEQSENPVVVGNSVQVRGTEETRKKEETGAEGRDVEVEVPNPSGCMADLVPPKVTSGAAGMQPHSLEGALRGLGSASEPVDGEGPGEGGETEQGSCTVDQDLNAVASNRDCAQRKAVFAPGMLQRPYGTLKGSDVCEPRKEGGSESSIALSVGKQEPATQTNPPATPGKNHVATARSSNGADALRPAVLKRARGEEECETSRMKKKVARDELGMVDTGRAHSTAEGSRRTEGKETGEEGVVSKNVGKVKGPQMAACSLLAGSAGNLWDGRMLRYGKPRRLHTSPPIAGTTLEIRRREEGSPIGERVSDARQPTSLRAAVASKLGGDREELFRELGGPSWSSPDGAHGPDAAATAMEVDPPAKTNKPRSVDTRPTAVAKPSSSREATVVVYELGIPKYSSHLGGSRLGDAAYGTKEVRPEPVNRGHSARTKTGLPVVGTDECSDSFVTGLQNSGCWQTSDGDPSTSTAHEPLLADGASPVLTSIPQIAENVAAVVADKGSHREAPDPTKTAPPVRSPRCEEAEGEELEAADEEEELEICLPLDEDEEAVEPETFPEPQPRRLWGSSNRDITPWKLLQKNL